MPSDPPIRILLVEDNPGDARLIAESLGADPSHFHLETVDRLADLRHALGAAPVDVILLDLGLPDGQGLDSFHRAQTLAPGIPIIVLSGLSDQDIALRAVREGAQDYLVKGRIDADPLPRIIRFAVERRRADEALRRSEARFRAAVEAGADAFFIFEALRDASGRVCEFTLLDLNSRAEKLVGIPRDEVVGRSMGALHAICLCPIPHERFVRVIETRESSEEEFPIDNPDGPPSWMMCQILPLGDGLAVILRDITERRRSEEAQRQTQKMEAIGQLAAGVAHDFRNLVSAIQSHLAHARHALAPDHPALQSLDQIQSAAAQASGIAGSLLRFSLKSPAEKHAVRLSAIVQQSVGLLKHSLPASIQVETRIDDSNLFVNADATQLQQIVMNLAINARDAMPTGGTLTISISHPAAAPLITPGPAGIARLTVRDTGTGMSAETRARIFEPYFTTKPRGQGTGLGLSIIHGIVSDHGGSITVDSRPGVGSTFTVLLPAIASPEASQPGIHDRNGHLAGHSDSPASPESREPRRSALLADHNPFVREVVATMLNSMNFDVLQAGDAAGAQRLARNSGRTFDLLVAAAHLPDEGGAACISHIRELSPHADAILISPTRNGGYPPADHIGILHHPFRRADLAKEIERLRASPA